ncbi:MAG: GlsB/YeaQ/YmgE family stress response membrane protein [Longimicrobiales bacterium]
MGGLIGWIIFGGVVGAIAKFVMPGKDPGGIIATILLGIGGSLIGGFVLGQWGQGWIGAILGTLLLLWLYKKFVAKDRVEVP